MEKFWRNLKEFFCLRIYEFINFLKFWRIYKKSLRRKYISWLLIHLQQNLQTNQRGKVRTNKWNTQFCMFVVFAVYSFFPIVHSKALENPNTDIRHFLSWLFGEILKLALIQLTVCPFCAFSHSNNRDSLRLRWKYLTEDRSGVEDQLPRLQ